MSDLGLTFTIMIRYNAGQEHVATLYSTVYLLQSCFYYIVQIQILEGRDTASIVDAERGIIQGVAPGSFFVMYSGPNSATFYVGGEVLDAEMSVMKIDPVLSSLRLDVDVSADTRQDESVVSLDILSGLFFFEERAEVTVSAILNNGRRVVITDPSEILLQSSNDSILAVDGNYVIARGVGTAEVNVSWVVCGSTLSRSIIEVTVEFSANRPIFETNPQQAEILENSPLGSSVATVFANDMDFVRANDPRRDTEYRFEDESYSHGGLFQLDRISGLVTLNSPLDRELRDRYEIRIEATDRTQRQAEQQQQQQQQPVDTGIEEEGSGLGSGSGSGDGGLLIPEGTTAPSTPAPIIRVTIDVLEVSCSNEQG